MSPWHVRGYLDQSHRGEPTFCTEGQPPRHKFHQFPYWLSYELAASSLPYIYLIRRSVLPTCWTSQIFRNFSTLRRCGVSPFGAGEPIFGMQPALGEALRTRSVAWE